MGKVLILEGPDGGGKTTLAKQLTQHGFQYHHEGPPPPERDQLEYYKTALYDALEAPYDVVFDRLYLGECIYGPIIRGIDKLGTGSLKLFERILASKQVHQYIAMPGEHTLRNNYLFKAKAPDDYVGGMSNFKKIVNAYYAMMLRPYNHVYDYEVDSLQTILDTPFEKPLPKGTIGSREAKYLFIADVPNHSYVDWPFFALTNSSAYFNTVLEIAKIEEKDLALSNAFGPDQRSHDPYEIVNSFSNLKRVFLMGARAQEWFVGKVNSANIPVSFIKHPSYMRRFCGSNPAILANEIRRDLWRS